MLISNPLEKFNYDYYAQLFNSNKKEAIKYAENPKDYIEALNNKSLEKDVKHIKWNK